MNFKSLLKFASLLDKQGEYKTSDFIFKFAQSNADNFDEDPLGIGDIQPSSKAKDPVVEELRKLVASGQITESQFWAAMEKHKPGFFENMLANIGRAGESDVDKIESNISAQGVRVNPKERDIFAQFYEISNDVFSEFINSMQSNFASALRTMARRNQLPEMFQDINDHRAGNLIMELIEPSTKEEFLTREYLELQAQGINLSDAVEIGSGGASSDINEYLQTYVESKAPAIASQASRVTGLRFHPEDIVRKLSGVTVDTLNETLDNALTELYYIYKG